MIYVYTTNLLNGACEIAKAINGEILRKFDGMHFLRKGKRVEFDRDDTIICWGGHAPEMDGVKVLNGIEEPDGAQFFRGMINVGYTSIEVIEYKGNPNRKSGARIYIPRTENHKKGEDLLMGPINFGVSRSEFWEQKQEFEKEWVVDIFDQKIIQVGLKVPKFELAPDEKVWHSGRSVGRSMSHPWVRTDEGGWGVDYECTIGSPLPTIKKVANAAIQAFQFDFGQVTCGHSYSHGGIIGISLSLTPKVSGDGLDLYIGNFRRKFKLESEAPKKVEKVKQSLEEMKEAKMRKRNLRNQMRNPIVPTPNPLRGLVDEAIDFTPDMYRRLEELIGNPAQVPPRNYTITTT